MDVLLMIETISDVSTMDRPLTPRRYVGIYMVNHRIRLVSPFFEVLLQVVKVVTILVVAAHSATSTSETVSVAQASVLVFD